MTHHPKERPDSLSRRNFLLKGAGVAVSLSAAGPLLAACGDTTNVAQSTGAGGELVGPGGLPLARPDKPVTLPRWEDPIASGLQPETGGTFTVFNYPAYLYKKVLTDFGAKYGVDVQYTPFDNVNSGLQRLASGAVTPDVTNITPDVLDIGVAGKLIKPLNLDYIPNLQKNIWPQLLDPFYDGESRYTVPYTVYATGIAWRTDKVKQDIAGMSQPWDIFWESQAYKGNVALLSENRETIGMALLRKGITDINTEDPGAREPGSVRPQAALRHLQHQGGRPPVPDGPGGVELAPPGVVGGHDRGLHLLPPEGNAGERPRLLEGTQGQGAGAERLLRDLLDHEEAGALASLPQLPPRQRRRL